MQGMDYEGFRQMVLGAHLYSIKGKDLQYFSEGKFDQKPNKIMNAELLTFNKVVDLTMKNQEQVSKENEIIAQVLSNSELIASNFSQFRKSFDKVYTEKIDETSANQVYNLVKMQNQQSLKKIFSVDYDIQYFIKIVLVFQYLFDNIILPQKLYYEVYYQLQFLKELQSIKDFSFQIPKFLKKSELTIIKQFLESLQKGISLLAQDEAKEQVVQQ